MLPIIADVVQVESGRWSGRIRRGGVVQWSCYHHGEWLHATAEEAQRCVDEVSGHEQAPTAG